MKIDSLRRVTVSRCYNHAAREAVARCVSCGRHFCRECVAEHEGRMICASCLRAEAPRERSDSGRRVFAIAWRGLHTAAALLLAWLFFYAIGRTLLSLPTPLHEGTLWTQE